MAREWRELKRFYASPGFAEEEVSLFEATGLEQRRSRARSPGSGSRSSPGRWPSSTRRSKPARDSKSLIGLLLLRQTR